MTENTIKLFATRAEQYPQPNEIDVTRAALEKAAELVPIFGPATIQVIGQFLVPGVERRREEWFKKLADAFDRLQETVEGFRIEVLGDNEAFASAMIQATRIAIGTHRDEKRSSLRNGLINIALGRGPCEDEEQMFIRYIEELGPWHIRILNCLMDKEAEKRFDEANQNLRTGQTSFRWRAERLLMTFPELENQSAFYDQAVLDLYSRGLYPFPGLRGTMTAPPHQQTEARARAFLAFIASPC